MSHLESQQSLPFSGKKKKNKPHVVMTELFFTALPTLPLTRLFFQHKTVIAGMFSALFLNMSLNSDT